MWETATITHHHYPRHNHSSLSRKWNTLVILRDPQLSIRSGHNFEAEFCNCSLFSFRQFIWQQCSRPLEMSAQHKKFTSLSNNFAGSILSLKQNQEVNERTSPKEYESTDIDLVLTAKAFWQHSQMATFWTTRAVTVQFETRAGVGQPQTISRQTGKTAHLPIIGEGASQEGCTLLFALLPKSTLAAFKCNLSWKIHIYKRSKNSLLTIL